MTNYPADLELRRRVAEIYYSRECEISNLEVWVRDAVDSRTWVKSELFDISLDAIMPLIFALLEKEADIVHAYLYNSEMNDGNLTLAWNMIRGKIAPADYCRAYLAAKGEKDVLHT